MSGNIATFFANVGDPIDWHQRFLFIYSGTTPGEFFLTPQSGTLEISYLPDVGPLKYWDGAAFATTPGTVATIIVSDASTYPHEVQAECDKKTVVMRGWMNGDRSTQFTAYVSIGVVSGSGGGGSGGDIEVGQPTDPEL